MADPKAIKERLLSTAVIGWRNKASAAVLMSLCSLRVAAFGYICFTMPGLECYRVFFYLSIVGLISEYAVIGYLYFYKDIPKFARDAVTISLLIANFWFVLFVFGLQECKV